MKINFENAKNSISKSFTDICWIENSGLNHEELRAEIEKIELLYAKKTIAKAKTMEAIATHGCIAINENDIFQEKVSGFGLMAEQRGKWENAAKEKYLNEEAEVIKRAWREFGAYKGAGDYGHTSPNTRLLLSLGFSGILERVESAYKKESLSDKQKDFYLSCKIVLNAMITIANRLADAVAPYNKENEKALRNIASSAPKNIYEAMQLIILYFFMHEYVGGTRVRTLGRLDVLLYPFYKEDIERGRYTRAEIKEMLKFFLYKFWSAKVPFDLPFCLGGIDKNGIDVTNEISYLIIESYDELNIHSPKIHIRISDNTPKDFVKIILDCIRRGNSSFVFVNDKIGIESLIRVGIEENDAKDYVPIGCYEPSVWGVEIGCTGNGGVNLAKAVELVFKNGDPCGAPTESPKTFEEFSHAIKTQIAYMTEKACDYIIKIEQHYDKINPDPLLSCQYEHSVECGKDVYEGGAKYNNSSIYFYSIATLVDSICAVKRLVFEEKLFSFNELGQILASDWQGHEKERRVALRLPEKFGNGNAKADAFTSEFSQFCANLINNKPNGRGGVFKAALFSIDHYVYLGERTMATPDGRRAGDPLSKNLCATVGMDKNGITSLINSVTKIDHADFPTGSVLDIMLHPSAVAGEDGLESFYSILITYFKKGGFAMQGNVFNTQILREAQANPEKYKNLQVRVCGWNAYFINLSKTEQDCFIRQAEALL